MTGMLPVTRFPSDSRLSTPDLCIDLRDNCPHTTQFIHSITVPTGMSIKMAKVGERGWSSISGYTEIPTGGSRYTLMLHDVKS